MANRTKYPGITRHARLLGVSYGHLRQVVETKERKSPRLLARYEALVAAEQRASENAPHATVLPAGTIFNFDDERKAEALALALGTKARRDGAQLTLTEEVFCNSSQPHSEPGEPFPGAAQATQTSPLRATE